ncbi:universal stress protein [Saccharothrix sp. S26]|uniref:universal stress protein n=1 Tax=Saccharothrix sp. S26 TaxID=2907215 RepID=UPI001F2D0C76|nr:universal stress protein [Saccharothrix sp. S26]MCE6996387.1 universal stress protein [Saccharothrix sp. S26]
MDAPDHEERRLRLPVGGDERGGAPVLVVGFDGQAASLAALRTAADLARRLGADLHVVHGVDVRDYPIDSDAAVEVWEGHAREALEHLLVLVREALARHPGRWTYHAWNGEPVRLLVTVADEQDALMIVVGTHRHRPLSRMVRRSVSRGLPRAAHRPVLLVADPADR